MKVKKQTPLTKLNYSGKLSLVIERLCKAYNVGKPNSFSVIEVGYEDCNVVIQTQDNKYVAKIFSKDRDQEAIYRYSATMRITLNAGVNHPELIYTSGGEIVYVDNQANGIAMVLMHYIEGHTFFELDRAPDSEEQRAVIEQAAKINSIDYHPSFLFDSWAIPNIQDMFDKVRKFIQSDDIKLVEQVIGKYAEIPVKKLPHAFVHGDFSKTNILKGKDGKIYILDFSVANWYPRIQELAIITANLLYEENSPVHLREKAHYVAREYSKITPLTTEEKDVLYFYSMASIAMEFMGAHQEKYINGNDTKETEYRLSLGRKGLKTELT